MQQDNGLGTTFTQLEKGQGIVVETPDSPALLVIAFDDGTDLVPGAIARINGANQGIRIYIRDNSEFPHRPLDETET